MRVSLSIGAQEGTCTRCSVGPTLVLNALIIADDHSGEADSVCQDCFFHVAGMHTTVPMYPLAPGPAGRRKGLKKARRISQKQECSIAEEYSGHTQPGSGNQPGAKGDIRKKGALRMEAKFTTASSFSLKLEELYKIQGEAVPPELPVFVIDYLESGTRRMKDRFVVLHDQDFKELLDGTRKYR